MPPGAARTGKAPSNVLYLCSSPFGFSGPGCWASLLRFAPLQKQGCLLPCSRWVPASQWRLQGASGDPLRPKSVLEARWLFQPWVCCLGLGSATSQRCWRLRPQWKEITKAELLQVSPQQGLTGKHLTRSTLCPLLVRIKLIHLL